MKATFICVLVALCLQSVVSVKIEEHLHPLVHHHHEDDHWEYPRYAFDYAVHDPNTGDHKHQWEERDGEFVIGEYGLVEPDGSLRIVRYTSHPKHGFSAEVKKIGQTVHHHHHEMMHHHQPHEEHFHHLHEKHHHEPIVYLPELIPIIRKPIGRRHTDIFKKIKELPIMKKMDADFGHYKELKPFKPLKYFFKNIVEKKEHKKPPIESLFKPHHHEKIFG